MLGHSSSASHVVASSRQTPRSAEHVTHDEQPMASSQLPGPVSELLELEPLELETSIEVLPLVVSPELVEVDDDVGTTESPVSVPSRLVVAVDVDALASPGSPVEPAGTTGTHWLATPAADWAPYLRPDGQSSSGKLQYSLSSQVPSAPHCESATH